MEILDKTAPIISSVTVSGVSSGFTINVKASDSGSGIKQYKYTITKTSNNTSQSVTSTNNTCRFTGLTVGEKYLITVNVTDNAGNTNTSSKYFTVTSSYY